MYTTVVLNFLKSIRTQDDSTDFYQISYLTNRSTEVRIEETINFLFLELYMKTPMLQKQQSFE